ncbi:MAG: hypothetical protein RLZZ283_365 [Candidatus Parcubacteria bacterium]|jgi:hypothetical protein
MTLKQIAYPVIALLGAALIVYFIVTAPATPPTDSMPQTVTLSGTYTCLPHLDTVGPQTEECAFGLQADSGEYYAVNFGSSAGAMEQFTSGTHITAEGFVVPKVALSTGQWAKYNMVGIFTVTRMIDPAPASAKLNINAVCEGALAYMTFPDAAAADLFVAECKEGKHPEVIEQYKEQMNLGDGATI